MTAITGSWTTGSARVSDGTHPFRKSLVEMKFGDTIETATRTVTLADIGHFAEFTGATFYAHTDREAAAANPLFGGIVAHGYLVGRSLPASSSSPTRDRCWRTSVSTTCAS